MFNFYEEKAATSREAAARPVQRTLERTRASGVKVLSG